MEKSLFRGNFRTFQYIRNWSAAKKSLYQGKSLFRGTLPYIEVLLYLFLIFFGWWADILIFHSECNVKKCQKSICREGLIMFCVLEAKPKDKLLNTFYDCHWPGWSRMFYVLQRRSCRYKASRILRHPQLEILYVHFVSFRRFYEIIESK